MGADTEKPLSGAGAPAGEASSGTRERELRAEHARLADEALALKDRLADRSADGQAADAPAHVHRAAERAAFRLMRLLLASTPDIIIILDRHGRFVTGSDKLLMAARVDSLAKLYGMYVRDLYLLFGDKGFAESGERQFLAMESGERSQIVMQTQIAFPDRAGRRFYEGKRSYTVQSTPMMSDAGNFEGALIVCHDTTVVRHGEADLYARLLLDATPLGATLWSPEGRILDCNQAMLRIFGLADKSDVIQRFFDLSPECQPDGTPSKAKLLEHNRAAFENGYRQFEWMHRTASGEELPMEVTLIRIPWKGGWCIASYARDLRAIKARERQAREAEERSRILLDSTPLGATLWDSEIGIFDCNQAMLHMLGLTDKDSLLRRFFDFSPEFQPDGASSRDKSLALNRAAFESGYQEFEWMHRTASGEPLPVRVILVRSPWKGGWCLAGYARDLREAKLQEQKMLEAAEYAKSLEVVSQAAQIASQAKSEFLAKMSHELRTPLNAAIGFLGMELQKDDLAQDSAENLEVSLDACYTLLHLINDILDISRIEADRFDLAYNDYHLVGFINEIVSLNAFRLMDNSLRAGSAPLSFRLEVDENLPSQLRGDDLRIKQVINNLLSNAFKYTEQGTVTLSVGLGPDGETQAGSLPIRFSVRDTGKGIQAENLEALFTSYTRFDSKANRLIEGTGLGLAISKNLVEKMGGRMRVESDYGKGSVFSCVIPQTVLDPTPLGRATVDNLASFSGAPHQHRKKCGNYRQCAYMPYAKVLVVDDVRTNLRVAAGMLQRYGLKVDCVAGGQEAVDLVRSGQPRYHAVFMDHMMPGMSGIDALHHIRAIDSDYARSVPVIILTANVIAGNEKMFLEHGFQDFLGKPIDPLQLDAVVNKWVKDARRETLADAPRRRWNDAPLQTAAPGGVQSVEGLDMREAVSRFGSEAIFFDVLRAYAVNTPQTLEQMPRLIETDPAEFTIAAHGIKGASYGVGASALGDMARELEHAAKRDDWPKVREELPLFLEAAGRLLRGVDALLLEVMPPVAEEDKPFRPAPDAGELAALYKASLACSHSDMEEHLRNLEQYRYHSNDGLVVWLRRRVDALDYDLIAERLARYAP